MNTLRRVLDALPMTGAAAGLALALLAGCADRTGIATTAKALPAEALGLRTVAHDWPAADWWRRFRDPQLDALVERALADGPSVAIAAARLARAESNADFVDAGRVPQVGAAIDMTRQRYTENGVIPKPLAGSVATSNSLLLNLNWEIDLFGRNRAALDAALGQARAAQADLQAARVLLSTQVTRVWLDLGRLIDQRTIAGEALAQQEKTVALVRERVAAGLDSRADLRLAEAGPPEARRQLAVLEERIALARNALAALTVQPAAALAALSPGLPAIQAPRAPAEIPADLLGRRADVVAARWRVEAALSERDVALAQFYPNVNLAAFAGLSSLGLNRWFESGSGVYGAGPAVRLPIFDAGRLRANLRGRTADFDAAVHGYNALLTDAVRDVADHVASLRHLAGQAEEQRAAQSAAEDAYAFALERYRAGLGNYLGVLKTQTAVLAHRATAVDLRARALDLDATLARALGGGAALDLVANR